MPFQFLNVVSDPEEELREEGMCHAPQQNHVWLDQPVAEVVEVLDILAVLDDGHGHDTLDPGVPLDLRHPSLVREVDVCEEELFYQPGLLHYLDVVTFIETLYCVSQVPHDVRLFKDLIHPISN